MTFVELYGWLTDDFARSKKYAQMQISLLSLKNDSYHVQSYHSQFEII